MTLSHTFRHKLGALHDGTSHTTLSQFVDHHAALAGPCRRGPRRRHAPRARWLCLVSFVSFAIYV